MEYKAITPFSFDYKSIVIDEIALDGLEGIGIDLLWKRIEYRISAPVTEKLKLKLWNFIIKYKEISLYKLPVPAVVFEPLNRFNYFHEESGLVLDPPDYIDGPYELCPVKKEYGSSVHYRTRTLLDKNELETMGFDKVVAEYGQHLVMVASIDERWKALAPHLSISLLSQLLPSHFYMLEVIGKSRENGQMSYGKTNMHKVTKDAKLLFLHRKHLITLDLIGSQPITQIIGNKGVKGNIMRLKRFHLPSILTIPNGGKIFKLKEYLKQKQNYSERCSVLLKDGLLDFKFSKKIRKQHLIFNFSDKTVIDEQQNIQNDTEQPDSTGIKRKYVSLSPSDDESDQSDDEKDAPEARPPCQYKIKVSLLRQAYESLLEAGIKGCTQLEMAHILGIDVCAVRILFKIFMRRNLTRKFIHDKGKVKSIRYVAVSVGGDQSEGYELEKKEFLSYMNETVTEPDIVEITEPPIKRPKLEETFIEPSDTFDIEPDITEVDFGKPTSPAADLFSIFNTTKPSLRQLRFINGIIKVIKKKQIHDGYFLLTTLVSEEINEPPMDAKSVKMYVEKLSQQKKLKIIKMRKPGTSNYLDIICAPQVKTTDSIIRSKYRHLKTAYLERMQKLKKAAGTSEGAVRPQTYPRYMKLQKTHEVIFETVYCTNRSEMYEDWSEFPEGFCTILHLIPEVTVEFALGNVALTALSEISHCNITPEMMNMKLKYAPKEVFKAFLLSQNFQSAIRSTLKYLAMLGLIQLIETPGAPTEKPALQYMFYVNRRAKFLNTTGIWPRDVKDKSAIERQFYFESMANVDEYWTELYRICTNTTVRRSSKPNKSLFPPEYSKDNVKTNDNGQIHGNGLGACGFHSAFYMEHSRNWLMYISSEVIKTKPVVPKVRMNVPRRRAKKAKVVKKAVVKPKVKRVRSRNLNKHELVTYFSPAEDKILALCKAAMFIISPNTTPEIMKLRNRIAREILITNDPLKTACLCHNRTLYLERTNKVFDDNDYLIYELRRRGISQKYEGILSDDKNELTSSKLFKAFSKGIIPGMELVYTMLQLMKSEYFNRRVPCVAPDLEDFHKKFILKQRASSSLYSPTDITNLAIKEGIVQTIMLSFTNELSSGISKILYRMFENYTEEDLQNTIDVLRSYGVIAARDKLLNNQVNRRGFQDLVQSSFKIAVAYQRKWICRLNSEFVANLQGLFDANLSEMAQTGFKGSPELNCFLFEAITSDILRTVFITYPTVASTHSGVPQEEQWRAKEIDLKYNLVSGKCGGVLKDDLDKFCEFTKNVDCKVLLDAIGRESLVVKGEESTEGVEDYPILAFLKSKEKHGATFTELLDQTQLSSKELHNVLTELESKNIIKRVGYMDNRIVLSKFAKPWTMNIDGTHFLPSHWLKFDFGIRYDIFFKWAGVVVNRVFENPGCSIGYLARCAEVLTPRATQQICIFLEQCKCVQLKTIRVSEADLFSDENEAPIFSEFSEYELPENILVFPVKNSLTSFARLRKRIFEECYASTSNT